MSIINQHINHLKNHERFMRTNKHLKYFHQHKPSDFADYQQLLESNRQTPSLVRDS